MFKNGKNRRKGLFWGAKIQKVKSIGGSPRLGYRHTLGWKKILGIYFLFEKKFFCVLYFFEIFLKIFRGYRVSLLSAVMLLFRCHWLLLRVVVLCPCIDILVLRLFLGDFRRGKLVLGIVTHFSLLGAKFKGFEGLLFFRVLYLSL